MAAKASNAPATCPATPRVMAPYLSHPLLPEQDLPHCLTLLDMSPSLCFVLAVPSARTSSLADTVLPPLTTFHSWVPWILSLCFPKFMCWNLNPNVIVFEGGAVGSINLKNKPASYFTSKKKKSVYLGITEDCNLAQASHGKTVTKSNKGEKHCFIEKEEVGRGCLKRKPIWEKKGFRAMRYLISSRFLVWNETYIFPCWRL